MYQLRKYGAEEQKAIKACAIEFMHEGTISSPTIVIEQNKLYSQLQLQEICSAFILLTDDRFACAEFAKTVFSVAFSNTVVTTIERKIKGKDTMQIKIDTYWEANNS